jgi:anion-transporting  ArsA/GET3 family ATPase
MPVQETVDAVAELRELGMPVGAVIINQARARADLAALSAFAGPQLPRELAVTELAADLDAVGLDLPQDTVEAMLDQVHRHTERIALEVEQLAVLEDLDQPVVTVPFLIDGVDLDAVTEIADLLAEQGMVP